MTYPKRFISESIGPIVCCTLVWVVSQASSKHASTPTPELVGTPIDSTTQQEAGHAGAAPVTGQHFDRLTRGERNLALDQIRNWDVISLFRAWVQCGKAEKDFRKQNAVGGILGTALRRDGISPAVFSEIRKFIEDHSNPVGERAELIGVLGQAKTSASLDIIIHVATGPATADLKPFAIKAIRSAGGLWGDGTFHEELSPALERVWRESNDDELLAAVSTAIAKIGAPAGIELLLSSLLGTDSTDSGRSRAVRSALNEVINPRAVGPLAAMLGTQPPTSPASILAGNALVAMGDATASKALLDWIRDADASAAGAVRGYVVRTRHPAMLTAWESALDSTIVFRSEKNRDAVRSGLDEYRRNRTTSP